ncbi:MAG: OsmC family protein [Persicimonas sp.]
MKTRNAKAVWRGNIEEGDGMVSVESGALESEYSAAGRFEEAEGTNPEELIGAAHAGCFSMALSLMLGEAGYTPDSIETTAAVQIHQVDGHFEIPKITLDCTATIEGIGEDEFLAIAQKAKEGCPVSGALQGPEISLNARLA